MSSLLFDHPMVSHEKWEKFTKIEHRIWHILFKRQTQLLKERAANEMIDGIKKLRICNHQIPKFSELNEILRRKTGFSIVPVKGFIPESLFLALLADRKFPVTCFIRSAQQLDYLEEPDIFHDIFGHIPLLVNPIFADFMQQFGLKGLQAIELGMLRFAAALYWFTVEFGLIKVNNNLRIYGAGISSSKGESIYCLDSPLPTRVKFDLYEVIKTQYHINAFQKTYFVIESFQQLFDTVDKLNWQEVRANYLRLPEIK